MKAKGLYLLITLLLFFFIGCDPVPIENNPPVITWTSPGGSLDRATGRPVIWTASQVIGVYEVHVSVTDGAAIAQHTWSVTVKEGATENQPPEIVSTSPSTPFTLETGETIESCCSRGS